MKFYNKILTLRRTQIYTRSGGFHSGEDEDYGPPTRLHGVIIQRIKSKAHCEWTHFTPSQYLMNDFLTVRLNVTDATEYK
jgi:hypothetical protein